MQWFRMYAEAIDDEKLRLLAYEDRWHFVAMLCLKSQGTLDNLENLDRRIGIKMGLRVAELDEVKRRLMEVDLIDENYQPVAWCRRQYESDSPAYKAAKQRKYRDNHKALRNGDVTVTTALPPRTEQNRTEQNRTEETYASSANANSASARPKSSSIQETKILHNIPLADGSDFGITSKMVGEFEVLYPAVDIRQTLNEIRGWNLTHPDRRKTKRGVMAHVNTWLAREQNKGV